jgi:hypothetical protein
MTVEEMQNYKWVPGDRIEAQLLHHNAFTIRTNIKLNTWYTVDLNSVTLKIIVPPERNHSIVVKSENCKFQVVKLKGEIIN